MLLSHVFYPGSLVLCAGNDDDPEWTVSEVPVTGSPGTLESRLTCHQANKDHLGSVRCDANNSHGVVQASATLNVFGEGSSDIASICSLQYRTITKHQYNTASSEKNIWNMFMRTV